MIKQCSKCKQEKSHDEFYKSKSTKDLLDTRCKECSRTRAIKYYDSEKAKIRYKEFKSKNPSTFKPKPAIERILSKIEIVTESGCWIFMGRVSELCYGMIGNDAGNDKKLFLTHRKTFEYYVGDIPDGLFVCHRCDVPSCCNPSHLFLGTQKENMEDRSNKGRSAIAEKNGKSKITNEQVNLIIEYKKNGNNLKELSRILPISYWQVWAIANGVRRTYLSI
jgi:hypothetical protein